MIRSNEVALRLRTIPAINSALPGGISDYFQSPKNDHYMSVRIISETTQTITSDGMRDVIGRVELRIIGGNVNATSQDLYDIADVIQGEIDGIPCNKIFSIGSKSIRQIRYDTNSGVLHDNNFNRPVLVVDYLFSYYE